MGAAVAFVWMYSRYSDWPGIRLQRCRNYRIGAALAGTLLLFSISLSAQPVDVVNPGPPSTLRATDALPATGGLAALPLQSFSVAHGIGVLEDDGNSYWPGFPAKLQAPATFHFTPTATNTYMVQRVAYQFDDPSQGSVLYDGSARPILGFLDANYVRYALPVPFSIGGQQYTTLSVSTWGAVAFGNADSSQVNYDPTVVSSMFHIPTVAVWYELFYYPATARIITKNKAHSVVVTWQNLISRHSQTPCTFQIELFTDTGEIQLSYQSLPVDDGLVGVNTGTETFTRQTANGVPATDIPTHLQASKATFDDYGGTLAGITLTLKAPVPNPDRSTNESFNYTLMLNGQDVIAVAVFPDQAPFAVVPTAKIPDFPVAQIDSWELKLTGDTLSIRVPTTSLEPYLNQSGINTW
ncbi:MAG TPA: hypothetical protein VEZ11_05505, partial [Thermoanaerobaculia bacterium]|nr:hypothetical protein [Thermoanaerobaculia bacterium]